MKYKWLLFDADGTLFDYAGAEALALENTFAQMDAAYKPEYLQVYQRVNSSLWLQLEQGGITPEKLKTERFALLFQEIGACLDVAFFSKLYLQNLAASSRLIEDAAQVVQTLHEKYQIAIITNGLTDVQRPRIARSGIQDYVRAVIISEEIGVAKPDPAYFETARQRLGGPDKEEILIIGDSLTSDILGGHNSGIDTCWFNPAHKRSDLDIKITYEIGHLTELLSIL